MCVRLATILNRRIQVEEAKTTGKDQRKRKQRRERLRTLLGQVASGLTEAEREELEDLQGGTDRQELDELHGPES